MATAPRWNQHHTAEDVPCLWSLIPTTDPATTSRCPAGCATSIIEQPGHARLDALNVMALAVLHHAAETHHTIRGADIPTEVHDRLLRTRHLTPDPARPGTYRAALPCKCPPGEPIAGQHRRDCPVTRTYDHLADALDELTHKAAQASEAYDDLATLLTPADAADLADHLALLDQATTALAQLRDHADRMTNPAAAPH
ncbi:hypothetical protein QTQ03_28480 [Micromonospora sp. WMMA1363]|uniref:hypothetical protein n=1 Tax=Micromonospora sp. WMMA1363 TaxID=3053985 RepID=UPI00259CE435|nr:hypothetical protein [Micromonospora sp. WMMA1363]MDM4723344.1 hypothetical protein [Micromonospora sp. WMMA1363]